MTSADLARAARALLGEAVAVAACDPRAPATGLLPAEAAAAGGMVERRRREFAAGRRAARAALSAIGRAPAAIPVGADRAPGWPAGLVGSIAHSATRCLAALARREALTALGLDLEPDDDLPAPLWDAILTPAERRRLAGAGDRAGRLATLAFSAKEAVYKCQHPLTGALLAFRDVEIDLDPARGAFGCRFAAPMPAVGRIEGRFAFVAGHVLTTATIRGTGSGAMRDRPRARAAASGAAPFTNNYLI